MTSLLVAVLLGVCHPNQSDSGTLTVKDVERKLVDAFAHLQSYSGKLSTHVEVTNKDGRQRHDMEWEIHWMRKGDQVLFRKEGQGTSLSEFEGKDIKTTDHYLHICDGKYNFAFNPAQPHYATKQDAEPGWLNPVKADFDRMGREGTLKLLPDETVSDVNCYVIEFIPTEKRPDDLFDKSHHYYARDSGIEMKSLSFDQEGKVTHSKIMADLRINGPIKPEFLEVELPEGIELIDQTKK